MWGFHERCTVPTNGTSERHRIPKITAVAYSPYAAATSIIPAMKFDLVDQVLEQSENRIVTVKQVTQAEEYLADHFPTFPILPGVLMLEAMVQAASRLCSKNEQRLVLGEVKSVKYGAMVRPGDQLRIEVTMVKTNDDGSISCKGKGTVHRNDVKETQTAVSGRFTIRPVRMS